MGACTSAARHRKKHHRQLHKRTAGKSSPNLDKKQVSFPPFTVLPKAQSPRPQSLFTNFDALASPLNEPVLYKTDTNSLIQLYSTQMSHNYNPNRNSWVAPSAYSTIQHQSRIPVSTNRLPAYQSTVIDTSRHPNETSLGTTRTMSLTNRPALAPMSSSPAQPRLGFIPRPTAPAPQQSQTALLQGRSRSISPTSKNNPHPSLAKTQTLAARSSVANATKPKTLSSPAPSVYKAPPPVTSVRPRTVPSPRAPSTLPSKTDINAARDRYSAPKRMTFLTRRTPITNAMKPSPIKPAVIDEKSEYSSSDERTNSFPVESQNDDAHTESTPLVDSAYASTESPSNRFASATRPAPIRHRTPSTLSTSSDLSNALKREGLLDDDNCSLKSDDLICDYDDTLTLDSVSKTSNRTNSGSSNSLSLDASQQSSPSTRATNSSMQKTSKDSRATPTPNNLRESLDELTQLSHRLENTFDHDHPRLLTRSISLKPPSTSLPPREDGEQITMDVESYRQVMKDVMVVKTILHQLDRLLKHSDGANMTDSMLGSFHESMISSRHQSLTGPTQSIDENSSYDDLTKELMLLRKEREQDKQTIKLLQEQMYKYSSQTNGS